MPKKRLRVALDARMLGEERVGIGNYIVNLVNAFGRTRDLGFHLDVLVQDGAPAGCINESEAVRLLRLPPMSNWRRLMHQLLSSAKLLGDRYDVVHFPDYPVALGRLSAKLIVTIPDASVFKPSKFYTLRKYLPKRLLYPIAAARADAVITYSDSSRRDLEEHLPALRLHQKISVIPLGPPSHFEDRALLSAERVERVRARYGLRSPFILFVGTIEPRKNLRGLLEAFAAICLRVPHELVIVGPRGWGSEYTYVREKSRRLGSRVRFLEYVPDEDLPAIYRLSTLLAYPSFCEGFGLPVVEAFSAGTAVLTSSTSSMAEIGSGAAVLVDPSSRSELVDGLLRVCTDERFRAELVDRGHNRVRQYSWERCALETASVYLDRKHIANRWNGATARPDQPNGLPAPAIQPENVV